MKTTRKILSAALAATLALGVSGLAALAEPAARDDQTSDAAMIYLVPGSYTDKETKKTVFHEVTDGVTKLSEEQCAAIHTPNAYLLIESVGADMPEPSTSRAGYTFNGWWTIENAQVVYHDTVPVVAETTYFYADWRAALSQPMDPVNPPDDAEEEIPYYLEITRAATGNKEKIALYVSATDVPNAEQLGFGGPVQLYNEWFLLEPGDDIRVFVSGLYSKKPTVAPQLVKNQAYAKLEANGVNNTFDYIRIKDSENSYQNNWAEIRLNTKDPAYGYVGDKATRARHFRIYIKFYDDGDVLTMYMEPQD